MPSLFVLQTYKKHGRHLPDVETMVSLQQGLQQVYCVDGINKADAVLSEPNGIAYAQGSTYLQLHKVRNNMQMRALTCKISTLNKCFSQARICFSDMSEIVRSSVAYIPRPQIMLQLFGAMTSMGLKASDLLKMQDHRHMFEFLKATLAAAMMDGKQTPYYSDYVLQSVRPIYNEAVALANLQPIPGNLVYEQDCTACFYRQHTNGQWHRFYICQIFGSSCVVWFCCIMYEHGNVQVQPSSQRGSEANQNRENTAFIGMHG